MLLIFPIFGLYLTVAPVAVACAPLQLLGIKSSSLINKIQHAQKDKPGDKGKLRGKKITPRNIIYKYDAEISIRVKKVVSCPMNTVCLTQLWGLGPKPEQGDLCHPDCARLKLQVS